MSNNSLNNNKLIIMKKQFLLFILFIFSVFTLSAAKKTDAKSVRIQNLSSANTPELSTDFTSVENGKAFVRMFHNEENIKVQILVSDPTMQTKFMMQGLNVYLDISGKKSKRYCVQFPKPERPQMQRNMQQPREAGQQNAIRQEQPAMDFNQMILSASLNNAVLVNKRNKILLNTENVNIKPFEEGKLLFTIFLPLSSIGDKIGKSKIVSVGLSSEMEAPQGMPPGGGMGGPGGGMGGAPRGGGGMGPGGGMRPPDGGGGARQMGGGSFAEMSTPFNAWVTFGVD